MAKRLDVHPQTVRYRIRQLEQVFGGQLGDPEARERRYDSWLKRGERGALQRFGSAAQPGG